MADTSLADSRLTTTREDVRQAILQRTTRGMLTYNAGKVHQLEGELWAVPSTRAGWHKVDLDQEACDCEDYQFRAAGLGITCRHVYAAAIARARDQRRPRGCPGCYEGWVYLGYEGVDEDGEHVEEIERVSCRRCRPEAR